MSDDQLSARSGFNTGTEPVVGFSIQKATQAKTVVMKGNDEFTLLEGNKQNNRTLIATPVSGDIQWPACVSDLVNAVQVASRFYNTFGDTIELGPQTLGPATATRGVFPVIAINFFGTMILVEGEKITVLRGPNSPSASDLPIFPSYFNIQKKPLPQGGGGQSDGNCVVLREVITASGVTVGPPPGKAWRPVGAFAGKLYIGTVGHFGALGDNQALVNEYLIDENGVERFLEQSNPPIDPQTFGAVDQNFFEPNMTVLSYPCKLKYKLADPQPAGRVLLMTAMMEFDKPKDPD